MRGFRWLIRISVGVCGLLVAWRALAGGPIHSIVTVARPLNLASAAAVSLLICWLVFARRQKARAAPQPRVARTLVALALALAVVSACYWNSLWFPFTSDDYVIVARAVRGELLPGFLTQGDAGVAYRPLNRLLFAVQGWPGRIDPAWWHVPGLFLHLANCGLVFLLARRIVPAGAAVFAAALFGLHATHPEAVSWMNSRSDVLAAFFLTGGLLMFLQHWENPHMGRLLAALLLAALAVLSKESAYVFAPLAWLLVSCKESPGGKALRAILPFVLLEFLLFAWRWQILGGLGGYAAPGTNRSMFFHIDLLRAVKTLFWRAWAILFFPVNWGVATTILLGVSVLAAVAAFLVLTQAGPSRRLVGSLVLFSAVPVLPALPLALVGADLAGARVYYLPSVGLALLVAAALSGLPSPALRTVVAAALLFFNFTALRHELAVWHSVTSLARRTCVDAASAVTAAPGSTVLVEGLPNSLDGVYFLGNGFQECVELQAGRRLPPLTAAPSANASVLRWDSGRRRLAAVRP